MSDENENENENPAEPENEEQADGEGLADDVAAGVDEAGGDEAVADEWAAAMAEEGATGEEGGDESAGDWDAAMAEEQEQVQQAPLDALTDEGKPPGSDDTPELDVILDISVTIAMEVGRTDIPIRNPLQLNQGSVVELDRLAGEPLDVLVNGTLIAHGEL